MLNLNSIMLGTTQLKAMAEFYEKVIGRPADMIDGGWHGWQVGSCFLTIGEHSEMRGQNLQGARVMLNFESKEVKEEYERIKGLGATVIKELYEMGEGSGMWIATFADPDGNYFQLMPPWESDTENR